jgi:hypothetical protein
MEEREETNYSLSFADLGKIDGFLKAYDHQDREKVSDILYTNGFNVDRGYGFTHCIHRTLQNKIYTGLRVDGFERTDPEWIASGCASMDARIKAVQDIHLRHELRKMTAAGCASVEASE